MAGFIKKILLPSAFFVLVIIFLSSFSGSVFSQEKHQPLPVVTVINPIRGKGLGHQHDDLLSSLKAQWEVTKNAGVNATWLWQYSALEDKNLTGFARKNMPNQEFGLLLEIDRNFAQKSGVWYRGQGPSYFSDGLLLESYDVNERRKLIDTAFSLFKKTFGYYPKTVGAWWIGEDSLNYMQVKYGIVAAMRASDQFNLDVYSIWGTPLSIPYLSSKQNEGIPAASFDNSSKVVILQWAARDPTLGYKDPLYSLQDFEAKGLDLSYFNYLSSLYLQKPLSDIVVGLENGGSLATFEGHYRNVLTKVKEMERNHKVAISLAKDYAKEFLSRRTVYPQNHYFLTKAYNSNDQSFWYNGVNYRAGILKKGNSIYLIDLRNYADKVNEDFALLPNSQGFLRVNEPSIIDSMRNPSQKILIATSSALMAINKKADTVTLLTNNKKIAIFSPIGLQLFAADKNTKDKQKIYTFNPQNSYLNIFYFLLAVYLFYFAFYYLRKRNLRKILLYFYLSIIPLLFSYQFLAVGLAKDMTFTFDMKELFLFSFFPSVSNLSILNILIIFQIIPFIILLIIHYILIIKFPKVRNTILYFVAVFLLSLIYINLPYFPLDKSTLVTVLIIFFLSGFLLVTFSALVFFVTRSKRILAACLIFIPFIFIFLGITVLFSRSKIVLTPFEANALRVIKNLHKNVIFVYEADYSVKPIYKAVRPLISYDTYAFAEKLTGTNWKMVERPSNHILKISNYNNKLIVVPRFLGADLSSYETRTLRLKKIFDNAQIAIYESKK